MINYSQNGIERKWEDVISHDSVAVLLYHCDKNAFILVKQLRATVLNKNKTNGMMYELCAGIIDKNVSNNYIAFAAGSGITPMLSIIKTHLLLEPKSTFKLFYLNRMVKSIIFKEELEQLKNQFFGRFQVFYFLTKEKRDIPFLNGRFDKD